LLYTVIIWRTCENLETSQLSCLHRAHHFLGSKDELAVALAFNYKDAGSIGGNALGGSRRVLTLHVHELGVGWHCVHQHPFLIFILIFILIINLIFLAGTAFVSSLPLS